MSVLNILNMLHNLRFFSLQNAVYFIMLPCLVPLLFTFKYRCAKIWKKKSGVKGLLKLHLILDKILNFLFWCFSDRASQYKLVLITNLMHSSFYSVIYVLQNKGIVY
jgi:hypothetical protein